MRDGAAVITSFGYLLSDYLVTIQAGPAVSALSVNGVTSASYQYDPDGLLVQAGGLTLNRDSPTGLVSGTAFGSLMTTLSYNSFGEVTAEASSFGGASLLATTYQRSSVGRITGKSETVGGATLAYAYCYDSVGRLTDVQQNGQALAHYGHDANSNRISACLFFPSLCGIGAPSGIEA